MKEGEGVDRGRKKFTSEKAKACVWKGKREEIHIYEFIWEELEEVIFVAVRYDLTKIN